MNQGSFDLTTTNGVQAYLQGTRFSCIKVTPLEGGNTNNIYRVELEKPIGDERTVILKYGKDFYQTEHAKIPLDLSRQVSFEIEIIFKKN